MLPTVTAAPDGQVCRVLGSAVGSETKEEGQCAVRASLVLPRRGCSLLPVVLLSPPVAAWIQRDPGTRGGHLPVQLTPL